MQGIVGRAWAKCQAVKLYVAVYLAITMVELERLQHSNMMILLWTWKQDYTDV